MPRGETGEFCTRGYSVMLGYWNDAGADRARRSTRPAGCIPATSRPWTTRATSTSSAGSRTWSSAAARTSTRARSRSSSTPIPKIQDVQVIGVPDPQVRRGDLRLGQAARRPERDAGGDPRVLPGPDRPLQDSALRRVRDRVPDDRHRQDPEVPDARADDQEARAEGGEDGVKPKNFDPRSCAGWLKRRAGALGHGSTGTL